MSSLLEVSVADGKYTIVLDAVRGLYALRYGEPWRELTGDNLVLSLAQAVHELEAYNEELQSQIGLSELVINRFKAKNETLRAEKEQLQEALKRTPRCCPCQDYWRTDEERKLEK